MKIEIKTIKDDVVDLEIFEDYRWKFVCSYITYYQFLDILIQIKINPELRHIYRFKYDNKPIYMDKNGTCSEYPKGFFDIASDLHSKLI